MTWSAELRAWRRRMALGRSGASKALGIPRNTLRDWEQGKRSPAALTIEGVRARMKKPGRS